MISTDLSLKANFFICLDESISMIHKYTIIFCVMIIFIWTESKRQ